MLPPTYATCSACREQVVCTQQNHYPDGGLVLPFDTFGYYGGFSDNISVLLGELRSREWIMCHDCVVKFFETFPALAETFGFGGHHSCDDDVPCCRFAWQGTDLFGKNEFGVHTRTAGEDGKWHDDPPVNPYDN